MLRDELLFECQLWTTCTLIMRPGTLYGMAMYPQWECALAVYRLV
jgi:hypothetical protein